jgi:hypothetical protein
VWRRGASPLDWDMAGSLNGVGETGARRVRKIGTLNSDGRILDGSLWNARNGEVRHGLAAAVGSPLDGASAWDMNAPGFRRCTKSLNHFS